MTRHWTYHEEKLREKVLRRDNYECQIRGPGCKGRATQVDHIHPKSLGGLATPDNLRAACGWCNNAKGSRSDVRRPLVTPLRPSRWTPAVNDYTRPSD